MLAVLRCSLAGSPLEVHACTLRPDDLSIIGADNKPIIEPGDFDVMVGNLTDKFTLQAAREQIQRRAQRPAR
jgi:hypothetical protein